MTALLDIEGLSKNFGGVRAVQRLSFAVHEREILGLIGPNGAGTPSTTAASSFWPIAIRPSPNFDV